MAESSEEPSWEELRGQYKQRKVGPNGLTVIVTKTGLTEGDAIQLCTKLRNLGIEYMITGYERI